jgi:hypothetical protein
MPIFEDEASFVIIRLAWLFTRRHPRAGGDPLCLAGVTNVACGISLGVMDPSLRWDDGVFC